MPEQPTVALCVTCLVDQVLPDIGVATVRLLRRAGYHVVFPEAQTCCGQPFFNSGLPEDARRLAHRTIKIFEPYPAVVLPSGSCTTMIRIEYPHLLADDPAWHERAAALAAKTFELSEFLTGQAGWAPARATNAPTVTYHDSCHMSRLLHLHDAPRVALTAVGCAIAEMNEADRCCGFGGLFSLRLPEISNAMSGAKLLDATASDATILVTADPGCLMQLRGVAGDESPTVAHLATVLEAVTR